MARRITATDDSTLSRRLAAEIGGEVLFDRFSRGRYATDASIYQIMPVGVVLPRNAQDVATAIALAKDSGVAVLPRGGGTSQCGQTVGEALVIDTSKYLDRIVAFDPAARRVTVEPGVVLDQLNRHLAPHGLQFPVDISTGSRATIGGMTANNSCGARSIRYGNMVHNVHAIDALLVDGTSARFGPLTGNLQGLAEVPRYARLVEQMAALGKREAAEIDRRFPKLQRRVGGYNIDMLPPAGDNMAHLLVGSEGTLAFFEKIELDLQPLPAQRRLGICHFSSLRHAMEAAAPIVALGPSAVELVDSTLIGLARANPEFRSIIDSFVRGDPAALLLVEFAGEDGTALNESIARLRLQMADFGSADQLVIAIDAAWQKQIWEVRKAGLNIVMSMKGDGKPVSFVEDCAVRLEDLPQYTDRMTALFAEYDTEGTWYAHASVGCLHVRPILNLKDTKDVRALRAIAERAFAMVREYQGSHSGEHGDGIVRSEFHDAMFGRRMVQAFETVKDAFDPGNVLNPGKIVRPYAMDDRTLFRYGPEYRPAPLQTALDWDEWGGFLGAVEMCNNNGACRKFDAGVMCPSYRVTRDEQHLTRGRANTLRLALTGQLGADALTSDALHATMALCVGCKACRRECPTGVDMTRMKTEFLYHHNRRHGVPLGDRLIAHLPRYAGLAARLRLVLNPIQRSRAGRALAERWLGLSRQRPMPRWTRPWRRGRSNHGAATAVTVFIDTFNRYFDPDVVAAAITVLEATGASVEVAAPAAGGRPLCCGRTYLAAGMVDRARAEMRRTVAALEPHLASGRPIIGLEPACLLTFRDELGVVLPSDQARQLGQQALLLEEYLQQQAQGGGLDLPLKTIGSDHVLVHGHCHQKAFGTFGAVTDTLRLIPELKVETIQSSCCGMAGAFGQKRDTYATSMAMAEAALLPAVRAAPATTRIIANGTSCRTQIRDGTGRSADHLAQVLRDALPG